MTMENGFFEHPILNSPYDYPAHHWEMDEHGQPTQRIIESRRTAQFVTPIPKPRKQKQSPIQEDIEFDDETGVSSRSQRYETIPIINELRQQVDEWRRLPSPNDWLVTPETARLLQHWRHHPFEGIRPFFCQVEAVETAIWLTEVASKRPAWKKFVEHLAAANANANSGLNRLALKLATGAGKTTVMAMLIAWQTVNAVRRSGSTHFTRGFLVVTPGLTIKDRLRVLQPSDLDSYYANRELVPPDMLDDVKRAKIVITNYHAFKLRERMELSKGNRALLEGRHGDAINTLETEGQMLQRVMPDLMGLKNIMVLNDEAHHCYKEKPGSPDEEDISREDKEEAERNKEAARLWINGLEAVKRKIGLNRIVDLSATPFFLRGSGYAEGTLFPWVMSDFSLMDAIECGIVKLPRVPVADNIPGAEVPVFRNLWENIRKLMPKKGRGKAEGLDPLSLPTPLYTALDALYGHYEKTYKTWQDAGIKVPPCFIIVCNNTSTSKLVYDYVSGFFRTNENGVEELENGRLELFRNFDEHNTPYARPRTLLIDSEQLESGEALDDTFRKVAAPEIEQFRRERVERSGLQESVEDIDDVSILREVMNTVGKEGRLGSDIRCVVSVSMLTEGWDANTVTHVLGVRAFGTQLLCEQVIGRALRRQSYDLNEEGLFNVEYADVLGIPFDFAAKPVVVVAVPPRQTIQVKAMRPERDKLEIRFPRVMGYRAELPNERLTAKFTEDSILPITPELTGPSQTQNAGIVGESVNLTVSHLRDTRPSTILYKLTTHLLYTKWRNPGEEPPLHLFGQLKRVVKEWMDTCLICRGDTYPAQVLYRHLADMACERITAAINAESVDHAAIKALLDPFNPEGSTAHVNFATSKTSRWQTDSRRCHINWIILDSDWEAEFCRVAENHPRVRAYVKNHNLGFDVPYRHGFDSRIYRPDFIVLIEDGHGEEDLLHLVVEVKGYRREDAKDKKITMDTYWIPGVNNTGKFGRWAFVEFTEVFAMNADFANLIETEFQKMVDSVTQPQPAQN
ncbi:DEAD/DEAH box helicase family protein [Acidipila sp. 4G-K13]|nr:DEAD/DEAH box helicase family protein [Paracidobacterium acidisoli]